jgi:hypothetical protein
MKFSNWLERARRLLNSETGAALVEELVTIAIIGTGIVILVAMITTGTLGVRLIDDQVQADTLARSQMELIKDAPYQADPITSPYPAVGAVPGYSVILEFDYWNAATSSFQSTLRNDGLQKVTVTVFSGANQVTQISEFKVDR